MCITMISIIHTQTHTHTHTDYKSWSFHEISVTQVHDQAAHPFIHESICPSSWLVSLYDLHFCVQQSRRYRIQSDWQSLTGHNRHGSVSVTGSLPRDALDNWHGSVSVTGSLPSDALDNWHSSVSVTESLPTDALTTDTVQSVWQKVCLLMLWQLTRFSQCDRKFA